MNQNIFQSDQENLKSQREISFSQRDQPMANTFHLTQQQRLNINKRLPRGFFLIRKQQYEKLGFMKKQQLQNIIYQPLKPQRSINIDNPLVRALSEAWKKKQEQMRKSNRFSLQYTTEGRSRQSEKIKNIIQRFRKLIKNTVVQGFLNKIGYMMALNEIEVQNKKGMLTIDTFKARYMVVLETAKNNSFETDVINQTEQMIQEFLCYVQQARKTQFENNIQSIQKSIDKITRYLSSQSADAKTQGSWYIRKKKKSQRNDNYTEKQILYFGELIKKLPTAYLIGVWQIVNDRPFTEADRGVEEVCLTSLSSKKLRDLQTYLKSKLSQLYRSRQRKKQKMHAKKLQKQRQQLKQQQSQPLNEQQMEKNQIKPQNQPAAGDKQRQAQQQEKFIQEIDDFMGGGNNSERNINTHKQRDNIDDFIIGFEDQFAEGNVKKQGSKMEKEADEQQQEVQGADSSDSSMITDQEESDF